MILPLRCSRTRSGDLASIGSVISSVSSCSCSCSSSSSGGGGGGGSRGGRCSRRGSSAAVCCGSRSLKGLLLMSPSQAAVHDAHETKRRYGSSAKLLQRVITASAGVGVGAGAKKSMPAVQRLHDACKAAFSSGLPASTKALAQVKNVLDEMNASDVGLEQLAASISGPQRHLRSPPTRRSPPITYLELFECETFSMGIFCLPQSASIPLHNHPGMTVLSKVLYGSMHVKSFDWANQDESLEEAFNRPREAVMVEDEVLSAPCDTEVLFPSTGGNIHAFTALTDCAVLDVLAPPYNASKGRNCTYFREVSQNMLEAGDSQESSGETSKKRSWLMVHRPPADFAVRRGVYRGPIINKDELPPAAELDDSFHCVPQLVDTGPEN